MNSTDFVIFSLQITAMLGSALFFGQLMRRINQPAVLGEMIGGIIIGPTIFGLIAPDLYAWLFISSVDVTIVRDASIKLGMLFFLFVAGLEVKLLDMQRMRGKSLVIGFVGTVLPILVGVAVVYALPASFWGPISDQHKLAFALFIGMNLANSANPVIARILMDLGLLKDEIGSVIMTATIVDDLINWTLFAIILSEIAPISQQTNAAMPQKILLVVAFFCATLGLGRLIAPRALVWIRHSLSWPSGFLAFTTLIILVVSSIAEGLGIHAFFGAFLAGVAVSDDNPKAREAHDIILHFVLSFFAPIYFVSMGMTTNFIVNFEWLLCIVIVVVACVSKVGAVLLGARLAGLPVNRETWAIGFGLNARGATGIILAGVGLTNNLINERIFVAIVIMAVVTSLMSGPIMNKLLHHRIRLLETTPYTHDNVLGQKTERASITENQK